MCIRDRYMKLPIVQKRAAAKQTVWINPELQPFSEVHQEIGMAEIDDAKSRLDRFAPFIRKCFPETEKDGGIIESALRPIPEMQEYMEHTFHTSLPGQMCIRDSAGTSRSAGNRSGICSGYTGYRNL